LERAEQPVAIPIAYRCFAHIVLRKTNSTVSPCGESKPIATDELPLRKQAGVHSTVAPAEIFLHDDVNGHVEDAGGLAGGSVNHGIDIGKE